LYLIGFYDMMYLITRIAAHLRIVVVLRLQSLGEFAVHLDLRHSRVLLPEGRAVNRSAAQPRAPSLVAAC
jgi:hypothetical protein